MFSTILKEVTGYFDRHALVSAFFPNLVVWGLTLGLVLLEGSSVESLAQTWGDWPISLQAIALISFFVWIAFNTFLTINYQPALLRLYEGYWPTSNFVLKRIRQRQQRVYQKRWQRLADADAALANEYGVLLKQQISVEALRKSLHTRSPSCTPNATELTEIENNIKQCIAQINQKLISERTLSDPLSVEQLDDIWQQWIDGKESAPAERWNSYAQTLSAYTTWLINYLKSSIESADANRQQCNRDQFLLFPPSKTAVLPTQFGNIMRAAELYSKSRYNLDAATVWSRLQTALPQDFSSSLQSSKTAVDLMIVLSAYCLMFGIPLSIWIGWQASAAFLWIVPLGGLLAALVLRRGVTGSLFAIALVLSILPRFGQSQINSDTISFIIRLQVSLTLSGFVLLASWLSYQNALQAALTYGEQIKTAFDLYRWKALEAMNLKLPATLFEEKKLWEEIGGLLYRGYSDPLTYYQFKHAKEEPLIASSTLVQAVVANQTLLPYQQINPSYLEIKSLKKTQVPTDAITDLQFAEKQCTLSLVGVGEPLRESQLILEALLRDRIVTSFPVTPAMILGGHLHPKAIVTIQLKAQNKVRHTLDDALVLAIQPAEAVHNKIHSAKSYSQILVVAISKQDADKLSKIGECRVFALTI